MGTSIVGKIVEILTAGISGMATGIGQGVSALAQNIFLTGEGTTANPYELSVFGTLVVVFAGISLAVGLSRLIFHFVTSLGARN